MLSQRALLVIVKLVTPRFRVRVGVRVMVSFRSIFSGYYFPFWIVLDQFYFRSIYLIEDAPIPPVR